MWRILYNVLDVFAHNSARALITSLGLGLASGAVAHTLLSSYINSSLNQLASIPMLPLLGMFGIDTALSIVLGAVLTRGALEASKLSLTKRAS